MRRRPASLTAAAPPSSCHETHSVSVTAASASARKGADEQQLGTEAPVACTAHGFTIGQR